MIKKLESGGGGLFPRKMFKVTLLKYRIEIVFTIDVRNKLKVVEH